MVIRRALGQMLPNQGHYFNADVLYKRFTPAGPDHAQVAACAGMADYIDALAAHHGITGDAVARGQGVHDMMRAHEVAVLQPLMTYLASKNSIRVLGPRAAHLRAPTVAIDARQPAAPLAQKLAARGIMAGGGDFYAVRALQAHGIDPEQGVLRLSFVHYTSADEVAKLITALDDIL
jgi:selenocysteine lyase/cysteine desulfurase